MHAAQQSFVDGWRQAMWAGVAVMVALFAYVALRGPKNTTPTAGETETTEAVGSSMPA